MKTKTLKTINELNAFNQDDFSKLSKKELSIIQKQYILEFEKEIKYLDTLIRFKDFDNLEISISKNWNHISISISDKVVNWMNFTTIEISKNNITYRQSESWNEKASTRNKVNITKQVINIIEHILDNENDFLEKYLVISKINSQISLLHYAILKIKKEEETEKKKNELFKNGYKVICFTELFNILNKIKKEIKLLSISSDINSNVDTQETIISNRYSNKNNFYIGSEKYGSKTTKKHLKEMFSSSHNITYYYK